MELRAKIILLMALIIAVTSFGVVGVWIVRDMITSPTSIDEIVDTAIELGLDRLYVQVVGRADAFYKSDILPRSHLLKDSPNNWLHIGKNKKYWNKDFCLDERVLCLALWK